MKNVIGVVLLACVVTSCGYKLPTEPTTTAVTAPSLAPASIRVGLSTRGDHRVDVTATVLTRDGHFVPGVLVTFAMDAGSVSPADATTNGNGVAQAIATPSSANATLTISGGSLSTTTTITGTPAVLTPPVSTPPPPVPLPAPFVSLQPITTTVGASTLFTIGTYMPGGTAIVRVEWAFGDGATASTNSGTTSHTYTTAGSVTASVTATDTLGRSASNSALVTVNAVPPPPPPPPPVVPTLSAELTCALATHGQRTDCNVTATYGGAAVMASAITLFRPDWGDGSPQEIRNSPLGQHVYQQAGTYVIVAYLEATTPDGTKAATTTKSVVIP